MFVLKPKTRQEILKLIYDKKIFIFICEGCNEIVVNREEIVNFIKELPKEGIVDAAIVDYLCNSEYTRNYLKIFYDQINLSQGVLIFSCGVGVQTINKISNLPIYIGCNTFHIPGYKGVNSATNGDYDCNLCGNCYLNYTLNICPLTSCPKELLNGPCGGAKNGKCEVDKTKDCCWGEIYEKLKRYNKINKVKNEILLRKFYRN